MNFEEIIIEKYKCFQDVKITDLKEINVIIGRNNIGKSSILDVIEMIYGIKKMNDSKILLTNKMDEKVIESVFLKNVGSSDIPAPRNYDFGKKYIDQSITYLRKDDKLNDMCDDFEKYNSHLPIQQVMYWTRCAKNIKISPKNIKRILKKFYNALTMK